MIKDLHLDVTMVTFLFFKAKQLDTRTTVFRRTEDLYNLKMKASRGGALLLR